jgi:hypothetical protein
MTTRPFPLPEDLRQAARPAGSTQSLTRASIAVALGGLSPSTVPEHVVRSRWPEDRDSLMVLRAATAPHSVSNTPALTQTVKHFLAALKPTSAGADLLDRGVGLEFNGAAQIVLPALSIPSADWVGEGVAIPVQQGTSSAGPSLTPHKIGVIVSLTAEMLNSTNAEGLVRMVLIDGCAQAIDKQLLSTNAAAADRPAGILAGVAGLTPTPAGGEAALIGDLKQLAAAVAPVAGNGNIVLVGSPDVTAGLRLWLRQAPEYPVLTSSSLAPKTLIAVAAAALVSAIEGVPELAAARDAAIQRDTVPGDIGSAGGPSVSMFQLDSVALRLLWPITWCLRTPTAVAWVTAITW